MKAREFAAHMMEAGVTSRIVSLDEPTILVREGPNGPEMPVIAVKVRREHRFGESYIILEF